MLEGSIPVRFLGDRDSNNSGPTLGSPAARALRNHSITNNNPRPYSYHDPPPYSDCCYAPSGSRERLLLLYGGNGNRDGGLRPRRCLASTPPTQPEGRSLRVARRTIGATSCVYVDADFGSGRASTCRTDVLDGRPVVPSNPHRHAATQQVGNSCEVTDMTNANMKCVRCSFPARLPSQYVHTEQHRERFSQRTYS